jgi:hypothetical protein
MVKDLLGIITKEIELMVNSTRLAENHNERNELMMISTRLS